MTGWCVIFEINKVRMSGFVIFEFLNMTLTIERVFEKTREKKIWVKNWQKGPGI